VKRADKGRAVARYIGSRSGIPDLAYAMVDSQIHAPSPYRILVTTDRKNDRFFAAVSDGFDNGGMSFVVRYDAEISELAAAPVGMTLETFSHLLNAHYEAVVLPRLRGGE